MGDEHGYAPLGFPLEVLIATVLIGTFVVYGTPGTTPGPAAAPGEMAILNIPK